MCRAAFAIGSCELQGQPAKRAGKSHERKDLAQRSRSHDPGGDGGVCFEAGRARDAFDADAQRRAGVDGARHLESDPGDPGAIRRRVAKDAGGGHRTRDQRVQRSPAPGTGLLSGGDSLGLHRGAGQAI